VDCPNTASKTCFLSIPSSISLNVGFDSRRERLWSKSSELNQNKQMPDEVSFGEPSFTSFPYSELNDSEDSDIFAKARIRHFSQSVLSAEAWFQTANELIAAMDLLEPHVASFWNSVRALVLDTKSGAALNDQKSDVPPKHNLINQHMMLAGFAIENLCKGYLAGELSLQEREDVQAGALPESLKDHRIVNLVEQTGMTVSDTEKYLLNRITEAVLWRGRYPSAISHKEVRPFAQIGSDICHIKTLLQKIRRHVGAKDS